MGGSWGAAGGFFADADFDYGARIVLGAAASGTGDVGLVLATLDRVTDGDPQSWFDAWAFLAAAEYYAKALVSVDWLADHLPARQAAGVSPAQRP
jgi:hypothetical protein